MSNELADSLLADVQAQFDARGVAIDEVGIDQVCYPITVSRPDGTNQQTVAEVEAVTALGANERGTHMSRFMEVLEEFHNEISATSVLDVARELRARTGSQSAKVGFRFPLFVLREAPVTGGVARLRFDCRYEARSAAAGDRVTLGVTAVITSLCPCSKEISDYGAHSQRGRVDVEAEINGSGELTPDELLAVAEGAASAPIYPLLKRPDERYVTMRAYDNPAFVEDVARAVVVALQDDPRIVRYAVSVANDESIHDHRAVARIRGGRER